MKAKWFSLFLIVVMLAMVIVPVASAAPPTPVSPRGPVYSSSVDDAPHPLGDAQRANRQEAFIAQAHGNADGHSYHTKHGGYVELERLGEDSIFTIIAEFGNAVDPFTGGTAGPLHNQIPQPNRSNDNTTIWASDFSESYYEKLLFSEGYNDISMRKYYIEQSSNRYTVNGDVTAWVQVPFNEAYYGSDNCGSIVCSYVWDLVNDGADSWYDSQIAGGATPAEIDAYLSQFDVWDRYDGDGDGDFNEPDGYLDHFQIVHAGEGQETGGGAQGDDAIWSHRWYNWYNADGPDGLGLCPYYCYGGTKIGDSSYWIGDYTVEPENGGVGVFAHEFGHDLGLPDLYDTSGNTGGAENSTGFWTLYSSGSYGSTGKSKDGIGSKPTHMSALEKILLGWSNLAVVNYGDTTTLKLGPAEYNTIDAQQLMVILPDKAVDFQTGEAYSGSYFYHSGAGNNLNNTMTLPVTLPGTGPITLSMQASYQIETCWDYAYVEVSTDDGATFTPIQTSASTTDDEFGQNDGFGITGTSGMPKVCDDFGTPVYVPVTADLTPYAGMAIELRFRYETDGFLVRSGFAVDDISIDGGVLFDDAESEAGWSYAGFSRTNGIVTESFFNAYIAEFRQYEGYDESLKTGPYNFGFLDNPNLQNWVEHFPYQEGLLVWYYDESFADNNVGDHCLDGRCGGLFLPVDAHPDLLIRPDNGLVWRPRVQAYDSTFGFNRTDRICLHANSIKKCYGGLKGNPLFDDTKSYWFAPDSSIGNNGWASVPLPGFGVTIRVLQVKNGSYHGADWMKVKVDFP